MSNFEKQRDAAIRDQVAQTEKEIAQGCNCNRIHDSILVNEDCPVHGGLVNAR